MLVSMDPSIVRANKAGGNVTIATLPARLPDSSVPAFTYIGDANCDHSLLKAMECKFDILTAIDMFLEISWRQDPVTGAIRSAENVACCSGVQPSDQVAFRYAFESNATGKRMGPDWSVTGLRTSVAFAADNTGYDTLVIETEDRKHPGAIGSTVYPLSQTRYEVPNSVTATASNWR